MNRDRSDAPIWGAIIGLGVLLLLMLEVLFGIFFLFFPLGSGTFLVSQILILAATAFVMGCLFLAGPYGLAIVVKAYEAVLVLNILTKESFVLLQGLRPKLPVEVPDSCFTLRVQQVTSGDTNIVEEQAELFPTADGNVLQVFWSFPFRVDDQSQESLKNYARNLPGIVPNMAKQTMGSWIGARLIDSTAKADDLVGKRDEFNANLEKGFNGDDPKLVGFLKEYGLIHQTPKISNIQFDAQSQKLRNLRYATQRLLQFVKEAVKAGLNENQAYEFFMAEDDVARVNIVRFSGNVDVKGLEEFRALLLGGLDPAIAKQLLGKGETPKGK